MATDTLNMNAVGMPNATGLETTGAANANGAAGNASRMPAWINTKEGPGAVVMDVLRQPTVRKALPLPPIAWTYRLLASSGGQGLRLTGLASYQPR